MRIDPKSLLLTAEEEALVKWGKTFEVRAKSWGQEIYIVGTRHTNKLNEIQKVINALEEFDPDLVIVEGMADEIACLILSGKVPEISSLSTDKHDVVILERYQEQVYIAWKAQRLGKEVRSWDIHLDEQLLAGLRNAANPEQKRNQLEYYLYMGALKCLEMEQTPNANNIIRLITDNFGVTLEQLTDVGLTAKNLQMVSPKPIEQIDVNEAQAKTRPSGNGQTNSILRELNIVRDRHAIDVIQEAKQKGAKRIFVTAGGSHVVTWERAVKEIYH